MTRILLGYEASSAATSSRKPVYADFDKLVNPHAMICGDSGTGKTHTLRLAINEVIKTSTTEMRVHVIDVHGDIEMPPNICSTTVFSEASPFGLNPLRVNPDPHFGGVRKAIQAFINTLSLSPSTGRALGPKQQDVLRNLMLDVYEFAEYQPDDPSTWSFRAEPPPSNLLPGRIYINVPYDEKDRAKAVAREAGISLEFQRDGVNVWHVDRYEDPITRWPRKTWGRTNPTLNTLCQYAARRREMSFTGMGYKEAALLETVHKRARMVSRSLQSRAKTRNNSGGDVYENEEADQDLAKAKEAALSAFKDYISTVETGRALEALLKYDSFDSLSTVKQILDSLNSTGVFRDQPPAFDAKKPVWRYNLKALRAEEQKFFVNVRLREIFEAAVQKGESDHLREVIVIDEGAKFTEEAPDHIINVIALEARKFGLGIWFASQSPTQYSDDLLSTVATKVILGLDSNHWPHASRRLRIDEKALKWVRPREGLLVNFKLKGQSAQPWGWVTTPSAVAA